MDNEYKIFYALLFLSGEVVPKKELLNYLDKFDIDNRLSRYADYFNGLDLGLVILNIGEGYQMVVDENLYDKCRPFVNGPEEKLTRAAREVVAIIAYNQPITRQEIEYIRGVNSAVIIKNLLEKDLIKVAGRKDVIGKPLMYSVSKKFYTYFGLNNLDDLPTMEEWKELKE
ncbi:MAG: SMC-Scp complex subunit ScpB [Deferribacterota bacterium]|nr:SMC-Scp complex subunit ScpB [Deferribacterota bacterium]